MLLLIAKDIVDLLISASVNREFITTPLKAFVVVLLT